MDPEGLDVGLGEVFVEFPVAVNNRDINVKRCCTINQKAPTLVT